jgi:hypothetical protein
MPVNRQTVITIAESRPNPSSATDPARIAAKMATVPSATV